MTQRRLNRGCPRRIGGLGALALAASLSLSLACGCSNGTGEPTDQGVSDDRPGIVVPKDKIGIDHHMGETIEPVDVIEETLENPGMEVSDGMDGDAADQGAPDDPGKEAGPLSGQIKVIPQLLDFGFVPGGQEGKIPFAVQNLGPGALILEKFTIAGAPEISLIVGFDPKVQLDHVAYEIQPPVLLKEGAQFDGFVKFVPLQAKEIYSEMRVFTSDATYPDGFQVHIQGNKKMPCLQFDPPELDFGPLVVGDGAEAEVTILSCGELALSLFDLSFASAALQAGLSLDFAKFPEGVPPDIDHPLTLESGEKVKVKVLYQPDTANPKGPDGIPIPGAFEMMAKTNTFSQSEFMDVAGFAVTDACAMPIVKVEEGLEVPVGTLMHLSGLKSYSPYGDIVEFNWTASQPAGNGGFLIPNDSVAEPTFLVGVPGDYEFSLTVDDEQGKGTCQVTSVTVSATAAEVATFILTWKTVTAFEPVPPFFGQDLDLHFLHPNAAGVDADEDGKPDGYYHLPWDAFWYNAYPNWDNKQPTAWYDDDARLLYDNVDGTGPEVVVMGLKCNAGNDYRVGVHFFDDYDYGPVVATIQAHVSGEMVWETQATLKDLDLWEAGVFHCGPNTVESVPGPLIKHDYINPSFVIPP